MTNQVFDDVKISNGYPCWIFNKQCSLTVDLFFVYYVITIKNFNKKKNSKKKDPIEWWLHIFDEAPLIMYLIKNSK